MNTYLQVPAVIPGHPVYPSSPNPARHETLFLKNVRSLLLEKAFDSHFTVPRMCRDLCMSSSQLHRKLTALTGQPAVRMIQKLRLNKAQYLLASQPCLPITEVAFACGFNDPDYFTRLFKKSTGVSPREFRAGKGIEKGGKSGWVKKEAYIFVE